VGGGGSGGRLKYRLYRNPLLMIPVGGLLTYVFVYRWPKNAAGSMRRA
jgi:omega-6 fatty acid desaturase (delta-12 desaturase)